MAANLETELYRRGADAVLLNRADANHFDKYMQAHFAGEMAELDRAAERARDGLLKLFREDGGRRYSAEEHAEREGALLEAYDAVGARVGEAVKAKSAAAEAELARLNAADAYDRLSPEEQARANSRRPYVAEDARDLPPDELAKKARAALAAGDRPMVWLYSRYIDRRIETARRDAVRPGGGLLTGDVGVRSPSPDRVSADLHDVARELREALADPDADAKRQRLEERIMAGKLMHGRISRLRWDLDGSTVRQRNDERERLRRAF